MSAKPSAIDVTDPHAVVELLELTAEELERRGERLLGLARKLQAQAAHTAALSALPEERSLGSKGHVSEPEAITTARKLGRFDRAGFAAELGLSESGAMRWLAKLMEREHPVIERLPDGGFAYINPSPVTPLRAPRQPKTHAQRASKIGTRMGSGGEAGTGKAGDLRRGLPAELVKVIDEAVADGWKLSRQGSGHMALTRNGQVAGFAKTPRNPGNAAIQLRQTLRSPRLGHNRVSRNGHA